ncbi:MAG: hypothetical protein AAB487_02820 [Patescibacteria group bacterium]
MLSPKQKFIKRIALPLALFIFFLLFVTDLFFVPLANSSTIKFFGPKDTSISRDLSPRIDSEAAMVVKENNQTLPLCTTLPGELWIFLLAAYLFLLLFNLFYDFEKSNNIHWFWESLYTLLALWGWYIWDSCHLNLWFPLYILKLGIIVYLVYLYLYYKKKEIQPLSDEDLENFEA